MGGEGGQRGSQWSKGGWGYKGDEDPFQASRGLLVEPAADGLQLQLEEGHA